MEKARGTWWGQVVSVHFLCRKTHLAHLYSVKTIDVGKEHFKSVLTGPELYWYQTHRAVLRTILQSYSISPRTVGDARCLNAQSRVKCCSALAAPAQGREAIICCENTEAALRTPYRSVHNQTSCVLLHPPHSYDHEFLWKQRRHLFGAASAPRTPHKHVHSDICVAALQHLTPHQFQPMCTCQVHWHLPILEIMELVTR